MKICVAQTRPVKGDIAANIDKHKQLIELALSYSAGTIIFPELSITGYEPTLAKELATNKEDNRLNDFQQISDKNKIIIGVGIPTKAEAGICISMIIFQPHRVPETYSKKYLHADEEPFFISGTNFPCIPGNNNRIAPAICYELSIPEHSANAYKDGAEIYIASVAKTVEGVEKAYKTLADIARKYSMTVLMSNCVGYCDNFQSVGKSAIWNNKGELVAQLDDREQGILIIDTVSKEIIMEKV